MRSSEILNQQFTGYKNIIKIKSYYNSFFSFLKEASEVWHGDLREIKAFERRLSLGWSLKDAIDSAFTFLRKVVKEFEFIIKF